MKLKPVEVAGILVLVQRIKEIKGEKKLFEELQDALKYCPYMKDHDELAIASWNEILQKIKKLAEEIEFLRMMSR